MNPDRPGSLHLDEERRFRCIADPMDEDAGNDRAIPDPETLRVYQRPTLHFALKACSQAARALAGAGGFSTPAFGLFCAEPFWAERAQLIFITAPRPFVIPSPMSHPPTAFWITAPGRGEILPTPLEPRLSAGQVEVRARFSGISRGTEALVFRGQVPASEHERMRAPFQQGCFPAPVKYGYISVGEVVAGDADLHGRTVFCLHPHQTRYRVGSEDVHPLPDGVPPSRAILAANMETAINGLWDAAPRIGDRVSVVGAGTLGFLCAWLVNQIPGCDLELIDSNPRRAEPATALSLPFRTPADARTEADLVIHTSGSAGGLELALRLAGFEATVLELSWFGAQRIALPLGQAFHPRRLTLRSSQVGSVATAQRPRWDHRRRMALALSLLTDPALDQLITGEDPFDALPAVMARLATDPGDTLMHRIRYD